LQPSSEGGGRPKILIVDDTPANLVAMRRLLSRIDADLIEASSGNEALSACLDHEFALILLDVQMPEMDGFEVAAFLAEEAQTRDTPIIFVTAAYADDMNRLKGYHFGAVDYIAKPISDTILQSKVRIFLDLYRGRQQLRQLLEQLNERNAELEAEVAERKRVEEMVRYQAGHDALTGLPNRYLFMDRLDSAISRSRRHGCSAALLYIDIDGFKGVNDRYGHLAGDLLLKGIAGILQRNVRQTDTVARLGGDEFAVIAEDVSAEDGGTALRQFGQKLCDALRSQEYVLRDEHFDEPPVVHIGASIGVALYPQHTGDSEDPREAWIHAADEVMYRVKHSGKNRAELAGDTGSGPAAPTTSPSAG